MADPATPAPRANRDALHRRLWRTVRPHIRNSPWFGQAVASLILAWLRFVNRTNPLVAGSTDAQAFHDAHGPCIYAFWHGQHLMAPFLPPKGIKAVALVSRSHDAEINAILIEKLGFETVRGSGGRQPAKTHEKGGARALIQLKRALDAGKSVVMIADISKAEARHAGLGVVTLAKLSGKPVVAVAYTSTRRFVLEKSWDKTTLNMPFGKAAAVAMPPVFVPGNVSDAELETYRSMIDARLDEASDSAATLLEQAR